MTDHFLPPVIRTSEPGSFAHNTLKVRIPAILRETIAQNAFPHEIVRALEGLHGELVGETIRPLHEDAPDVAFWAEASAEHIGRSWLDVPWFWAETYFYRRLLEATRYFQPGSWQGHDPFAAKKRTEWVPDAAPRAIDGVLADVPAELGGRFERLFHASLWGNRTDLSYMIAAHLGGTAPAHAERDNLLVDDTPQVWAHLAARRPARIVMITDNAGTELLADLALADLLLEESLARAIVLHLKPQPFYVSDAMPQDVWAGLAALGAGGEQVAALGQRLRGQIDAGRLIMATHWAYTTCLFYPDLPADLRDELAAADLVIVKGDANYRRLLSDRHWPPDTPFRDVLGYFPAPVVALRTFKAEIVVGLRPGQAERLVAEDPAWLVNGRRGVIQSWV
jgi:uncharacterized protein with ATP-grasp and redox domains